MLLHDGCLLNLVAELAPFLDETGETFVQIPMEGSNDTQEMPLSSPLARKWIKAALCNVISRGWPTEAETRTALDVVEGSAVSKPRRKPRNASRYQVEQKPLAQAVILLAGQGGTKARLPDLLARLNNVARADSIKRDATWPTTVDALGKQLGVLVDLLKAEGVQLERHRSDHREWSITPLESERLPGVERDAEVPDQVADTSHIPATNNVHADTLPSSDTTLQDDLDRKVQSLLNGTQT